MLTPPTSEHFKEEVSEGEVPREETESVKPKFVVHIYSSNMSGEQLTWAINHFGVSLDLHPRLPSRDLTIDNLPDDVIGLYL